MPLEQVAELKFREKLLNGLIKAGIPSAALRARQVLRWMFVVAKENKLWLGPNPCIDEPVDLRGITKGKAPVQWDQMGDLVKRLIDETQKERGKGEHFETWQIRKGMGLLMMAKMRPEEMSGLWWDRINWDERTITIDQTHTEQDGLQPRVKSNNSYRTLIMVPDLEEYLYARWRHQGCPKTGYVFLTQRGTPISKSMWQYWGVAFKRAGLTTEEGKRRFRPYIIRHVVTSEELLDPRHSPFEVARKGGHSERVMKQTYGHIIDRRETAGDKLRRERNIESQRERGIESPEVAGHIDLEVEREQRRMLLARERPDACASGRRQDCHRRRQGRG
jgi:integrase